MKRLTVLYDSRCGFCVKCRWWLVAQPKFVEMDFLPAGSAQAVDRFPGVLRRGEDRKSVV